MIHHLQKEYYISYTVSQLSILSTGKLQIGIEIERIFYPYFEIKLRLPCQSCELWL